VNAVFLLLIAVVVGLLGYRFFSKLVELGVFRPDYSPDTTGTPPGAGNLVSSPERLLPYHGVALSGGLGLVGALLAASWGWVPAFLWVLMGSTVAAGVYGMGSLWLARREAGLTLAEFLEKYLGGLASHLLVALAGLLLAGMAALCGYLIAALLAAYPAVVLPFLLHVVIALGLGRALRNGGTSPVWLSTGVALMLLTAGTALLAAFPSLNLSLSGALNLDVGGSTRLTLNVLAGWVILVFVYGLITLRTPLTRLARPRATLSAGLAVLLIAGLLLLLLVVRPPMIAPEFLAAEHRLPVFPWLFVTLNFGALAGAHLLVARGLTSRQMADDRGVRRLGYGGAVFDGLLALSALLIAATAAGDEEAWSRSFGAWARPADINPLYALLTYIEGYAVHAAESVGGTELVRLLVVLAICALLTTGLETSLRLFKQLFDETVLSLPARLSDNRSRLLLAAGIPLALALLAVGTKLPGGLWFLLGAANLVLALAGFLVMGLAVRTAERPRPWLMVVPVMLLLLAGWALAALLAEGWRTNGYLLLTGATALILITGWLVRAGISRWRTPLA